VLVANTPALPRRLAVDAALDGEQGIDAFDGLDRDWRLVEPPRIGIRLHQAGIGRKVSVGMHAAAVGGIEERRGRRRGPGKTGGRRAHTRSKSYRKPNRTSRVGLRPRDG
jgi:hypothetical protein